MFVYQHGILAKRRGSFSWKNVPSRSLFLLYTGFGYVNGVAKFNRLWRSFNTSSDVLCKPTYTGQPLNMWFSDSEDLKRVNPSKSPFRKFTSKTKKFFYHAWVMENKKALNPRKLYDVNFWWIYTLWDALNLIWLFSENAWVGLT